LKQNVLTGSDHLPTLTSYLHSNDVKRILLVTGKRSYSDSSARSLLKPYLNGFQVTRFHEFDHNPKIEDVVKGIEAFKGDNCQAFIAVGGGSVMDMAKLINAYQDYHGNILEGVRNNLTGPCLTPLIALPTTSGSGSEATHFAVVYIDGQKYSVASDLLLPNYAFLVPEFTHSANSYLTAVTGMDALTQAIESFWSVNSTEESKVYSKEALGSLWKHLPRAVQENDAKDRRVVMEAAHLAGKAINIAKTTAAHAISYSFTSYHDIPHGHAVALTIPFFCGYNSQVSDIDCNDVRGADYVRDILSEIQCILGEDDLEKALNSFIRSLGLNLTIPESPGGVELDIERILGKINVQRMKNNPRFVQIDDLRANLQKVILTH